MSNLSRYPKELRKRIRSLSACLDVINDGDHSQYRDASSWAVWKARELCDLMYPPGDCEYRITPEEIGFQTESLLVIIVSIKQEFLRDVGIGKMTYEDVRMNERSFNQLFSLLEESLQGH